MRKLSVLLFVLVMSLASFGQAFSLDSCPSFSTGLTGIYGGSKSPSISSSLSSISVSSILQIRSGVAKSAIITVHSNGDLYIKPSIVCDCDKCKRYDSLKFIYNIYTNKK
jgi:tRNA 2-selenouridine synthase SelU